MSSKVNNGRKGCGCGCGFLPSLIIICIIIAAVVYFTRNGFVVSEYNIPSPVCVGMRILHLSDIHWRKGDDMKKMLSLAVEANPDIIMLTGDTVDDDSTDFDGLEAYLTSLRDIAPVYAVSGNHDKWDSYFAELKELYDKTGIVFLDNMSEIITFKGESVNLCGIADPPFWNSEYKEGILDEYFIEAPSTDNFDILLFHRADMAPLLGGKGYDLILSGHLHGGIIRIPFIGGVASPGGNFFPDYDGGIYNLDGGGIMVVNRGMKGYKNIPRLNNPPEIGLIILTEE